MDSTKDHIYEGIFLQITFIEDAITGGASIVGLIEDENWDIQRCSINNFKHQNNNSLVQKNFGFGHKMSLINSYMRMARVGIGIDDPNSLIKIGNESKIQNMCR